MAIWAIGGLGGWRVAGLASCAVGGLRGWPLEIGDFRWVVGGWWLAVCGWRLAAGGWWLVVRGFGFAVCGLQLAIVSCFAVGVAVWQLEFQLPFQ